MTMEKSSRLGRRALKLVAAVVAIGVIVIGVQDRLAISRVRTTGKPAFVDPIDGYTRTKSRGSTTYTAQFTFKTESGQVISKKRSFPEELLADLKNGTPVKVMYDPRDPTNFVWENEQGSWWPVGLGVGMLGAAALLL